MIRYWLRLRGQAYLRALRNPWTAGLHVLLLLTACGYGWLLGWLVNQAAQGGAIPLAPDQLIRYSLLGLGLMALLRMVFPAYTPLRPVLPVFFPVSPFQRHAVSLLTELSAPFFGFAGAFVGVCALTLREGQGLFWMQGMLVLLAAHLLRRLIQYGIDFRLKAPGRVLQAGGLLLAGLGLWQDGSLTDLPVLALLTAALFAAGFACEALIREHTLPAPVRSAPGGLYRSLLWNNPKARIPLIAGLTLKLLILGLDLWLFRAKGRHVLEGQAVYWLFASPVILFTYVFNNTWGMWKALWIQLELRSGDPRSLLLPAFRLMALPVLADALLGLPLLAWIWGPDLSVLLFYLISLILLACWSAAWSLLLPMRIESVFQLKGSTSIAASLASVAAVILLSFMRMGGWAWLIAPAALLAAPAGLWLAWRLYPRRKYRLAEAVLKGR